jgi:hypothetical protein
MAVFEFDFGIWAEAEKNLHSGIITHGAAGGPQNADASPVDAPNTYRRSCQRQIMYSVTLANCYFAHNSSGFPVLLRFCDAQFGRSVHPLHRKDAAR